MKAQVKSLPLPTTASAQNNSVAGKCSCHGTQNKAGECQGCGRKRLDGENSMGQRSGDSVLPSNVQSVLRTSGQPLDSATRAFMERRFGHDFGRVRIHADSQAAESARAVKSEAYTVGDDVVFGAGRYEPALPRGQQLLAHELTHVVQQHGANKFLSLKRSEGGAPSNAAEQVADSVASTILEDKPLPRIPALRQDVGWAERGRDPYGTAADPWVAAGDAKQTPAPAPPVTPPTPPPPACVRPVNPRSTLLAANQDFGISMRVNWDSSTGTLAHLAGCFITEHITYSVITNPPFGTSSGTRLPESGTSQRIPNNPGIRAESGVAGDLHQHPRSLVRTPPSAGTYTVTQTYDYNSAACGGTWTPFANYVITYSIDNKTGSWRFKTKKTGTDGPFDSDEAI